MGNFRDSIGLEDKYSFSTELEFTNVYLEDLDIMLRCKNLPVQLVYEHKNQNASWDHWILDKDFSLSFTRNGRSFGGELSSKILTDKKEIWQELKSICNVLKFMGAKVSNLCSNHIRIDLFNITNERYFFNVLSKLIALHEIDINLFFMGDSYFVREATYIYARFLNQYLLHYIHTVDFNNSDFYSQFRNYKGMALFTRRDAINLQDYLDKKLIEIRYPNGSIEEKTIQNNINFCLKLVDAIDRKLFDPDYLTKEIQNFDYDEFFMRYANEEPSYENFEQLVKTISTSSEDENDFMSQYEYVLATKH